MVTKTKVHSEFQYWYPRVQKNKKWKSSQVGNRSYQLTHASWPTNQGQIGVTSHTRLTFWNKSTSTCTNVNYQRWSCLDCNFHFWDSSEEGSKFIFCYGFLWHLQWCFYGKSRQYGTNRSGSAHTFSSKWPNMSSEKRNLLSCQRQSLCLLRVSNTKLRYNQSTELCTAINFCLHMVTE